VVGALQIGVLALQGDVREHLQALTGLGVTAAAVRRPDELAGLDAIIVPGGESTTIGKLAVSFGVLGPLQRAVTAGLPAYGSCAGMILLANDVLDGAADQPRIGGLDVVVRRNAFGRQVDSFEADVAWAASGDRVRAVFIRAPWVESAGTDVEVLARVSGGRADGTIVAVRQGPLLATSFHPELTGDLRVHEYFVAMVRETA
jgi:5'-phosphate synthase pdxT subunit